MKRFTVLVVVAILAFVLTLAELSGLPLISAVASFLRSSVAVMPRVVISPALSEASPGNAWWSVALTSQPLPQT